VSAGTPTTPGVELCADPDCGGAVEDGYCDTCGLPAGAPVPAAASAASSSAGAAASASSASSAGGGTPSGETPSPRTARTSHRLRASLLGSARAAGGGATRAPRPSGASERSRSSRLGAGITVVPAIPVVDASSALMAVPEVPEHRRACAVCGQPVGRSRAGRPGRTEGFCASCRAPFSFSPKLRAGDVVAGQYEVAGCLAFGGLGWVYLARDLNVSRRWVVLKGLLNSQDPDAVQAAIAEREFLARVEHPQIVQIYNFVEHDGAGYIVMEYVGGTSLKDLLKKRRDANGGVNDPLPVDQAVAYLVEILPAFQHLHDLGLLYCDFKPDNVIQAGDSLKLIDLGGVRRADDLDSPIYGTVGYQAPEVPDVGPSVAADVYTIGRTLVSLAIDFRGNTTTYVASLPAPEDVPLFERHDSLHRLLLKACAPDPADRFSSCDELRTQLLGVLREIVALDRHPDRPADHSTPSLNFLPPTGSGEELTWSQLPAVRLAADDPQVVAAAGAVAPDAGPDALLDALLALDAPGVEASLHVSRVALAAGRTDVVTEVCGHLLDEDPWEWRAGWYLGLAALRDDDPETAKEAFNAVYGQVPGELAPKLALALACETGGEPGVAEALYLTCLRTDAHYAAAAAFGLARVREGAYLRGEGPLEDAVAALDLVPATSRSFVLARQRRARLLIEHGEGMDRLDDALRGVAGVTLAPADAVRLRIEALTVALATVVDDGGAGGNGTAGTVGGVPAQERPLREALDTALRTLVTLTDEREERVRLIDTARAVRPWTWT
jgi:serine/threonine-protein kinase PknG